MLGDDTGAFEAALVAAVRSGPSGERRLLAALDRVADEDLAAGIVFALGEADGPDGIAALRAIIAQPTDPLAVRTTALVALVKRQGVAASDVLTECVTDGDHRHMPGYALSGLASAGDDRAWDIVLAWLDVTLKDRPPDPEHDFADRTLAAQSHLAAAVTYLARRSADDWERQRPVVRLLRARWDRLRGAEQRWLTVTWPACDPSRPEVFTPVDAAWLGDWISEPLFTDEFGGQTGLQRPE